MIGKLTRTIVRTFAFALALCATTSAWAAAPVPVVVWDGAAGAEYNFSNRSKTVGGVTYYIDNIGEGTDNTSVNICATDFSYIQVANQDYGVAAPVIKASGTGSETAFGTTGGSTVIVKCEFVSGANVAAPSRAVLGFLSQTAQTYGNLHLGIMKYKGHAATIYSFRYGSEAGNGAYGSTTAFSEGARTLALTYKSDTALKSYTDGVSTYTWNTPDSSFTAPGGICIGGVDYTTNANRFYAMKCMKIYAIAIFDSELTKEQIANYAFPSSSYQTFDYASHMFTWTTAANGSSSIDMGGGSSRFKLFDKSLGADTTEYTGNVKYSEYNSGLQESDWEQFWTSFCYVQYIVRQESGVWVNRPPNYSVPGAVLRLVSGYHTAIGGTFAPFTLGGLLVEDGAEGYSFSQTSGSGRNTILGDPRATGGVPTWFVANESVAFNRVGWMYLTGKINFDIAESCTVNLNNPASGGNDSYAPVLYGSLGYKGESTVAGGELIMRGLGNISVRKLTASGAKLDYSNLTASRMATPGTASYIQGNLVIDGNTSFAFPADMAKNTKYALCSGTLTNSGNSSRRATISVGGDTFDAILTFDTSDATVSYVPIYSAVVDGDSTFEDLDWVPALDAAEIEGSKFTITGSGKVTGLSAVPASIELESGVTLDVTAIAGGSTTFSGSGTLLYTSSYPDAVPAGCTYEYVGSDAEASPAAKNGVTVNGTLKTSGYLSLTTFNLAAAGTLEVLDGKTTVSGAAKGLAGTVIVREDATLVTATDAMPDYDGTTVAHIYGTLDTGSSGRWCLYANNTVNLYAGATVKGTPSNGAINICKKAGLNIKAHPTDETKTEVYFQGKLKYNRNDTTLEGGSIITVDEGVALVFSGVVTSHDNNGGFVRKQGNGKIKFASGATLSSFGVYLNIEEGAVDLGGVTLAGGSSGYVSVANGASLDVSGNSTISLPLTLADGATLKIDGSASLTVSQAVTLPTGENERVTLDLRDATLPTGTTSSILLTASATLDLDVGRFEFEGASNDYYLSQNTTTGAVSIKLHAAKGSDGVYRDNLMEAFGEIVADHDLVITVLDGTGASNAALVKSANIAWDSENNQFLYGYAKIGNEPYISLTAAIEASTIGDTITLLRNTTEEVAIKNGTTLALGGFTVGSVSAESGYVLVPDDAENPTSYSTVEAKVSAEIGGNIRYFETLADALTAADGAGTITLIANCSENANLAAGVTLVLDGHSYTGELSGSGTVVLSSLTAPTLNASWSGTVELPADQTFNGIYFDSYGVVGSTVRLKGTNSGWFYYTNTKTPVATTIEIPQEASLTINGWSPSFANAFDVLKGAGTFAVNISSGTGLTGDGYSDYFLLKNVSDFTGSLSATGAGIAIGDTRIANTVAGGKIIVSAGKTPTIASGATWQAAGGFTVDGTLTCSKGGKIYGTGAAGTLALGGSGVIVNEFEGGNAQCFNAGAITVSGSLQVKMVGGWSNFGTWTLTDTASLGFDPGTDNDIWLNSTITAAPKTTTIHIYGNGNNVVVENTAGVTKDAAIHIHNGGTFQVATESNTCDYLGYNGKDNYGNVTVDKGGELRLYSRETYTRNTVLNGGTINLAGVQSSRSIDIHGGQTISVTDDSTIKTTATGAHWIFLRNSDPTFDVAEGKTLTVNAGFNYGGTNGNRDLIKTGSGTMIVNGYVDGSGNHEAFTQCKGVDIRAGTYELNAVQSKPGTGNDTYTVASGAKLKVGATGKVNTTTLTLNSGSLLEFGAGNATLIDAGTVTLASGNATLSFSEGVVPTSGTKLIGWSTGPIGSISFAGGVNYALINGSYYYLEAKTDGLYVYDAAAVADDVAYGSISDAITAAGVDGTVTLLADVTDATSVTLLVGQSLAVNGKTVTGLTVNAPATGEYTGTITASEGVYSAVSATPYATAYAWSGAEAGDTKNWTSAENWTFGGGTAATRAPVACDSVSFGSAATITLDDDVEVAGMSVSAAVTLAAASDTTLAVSGGVTLADAAATLTVPSSVTLTGDVATSVADKLVKSVTADGAITYSVADPVAEFDGESYGSIANAIDAAVAASGGTVTLLDDSNENITLPNGVSFCDGGYTYTGEITTDTANHVYYNTTTDAGVTTYSALSAEASVTANAVTTYYATFDAARAVAGANTITLLTDITINVAENDTLTISSPIAGSFGITKTGAGTLVLNSAHNTYSGATTVSAGVLDMRAIHATSTYFPIGEYTVAASATLKVSGALITSALTLSGTFDIENTVGGGYGAQILALTLHGNSTIKMSTTQASLTVMSTLNLPETGTVNVDVSGQGLTTETKSLFANAAITTETLNKFTLIGAPTGYVTSVGTGNALRIYLPVATIDGTTYETLGAAFDAASNGDTITLVRNDSSSINIHRKSITFVEDGGVFTGTFASEYDAYGTYGALTLTALLQGADSNTLFANSEWAGTVVLPADLVATGLDLNNYGARYNNQGHSWSTVQIQGITSGYLANATVNPIVELVGNMKLTACSQGFANTFEVVKGSGDFDLSTATFSDTYAYFLLKNIANYTGSIKTKAGGAGIVLGGTTKPTGTDDLGKIIVNTAATIGADETWVAPGGVRVSEGVVVTMGAGASISGTVTLKVGASVKVPVGTVAPTVTTDNPYYTVTSTTAAGVTTYTTVKKPGTIFSVY